VLKGFSNIPFNSDIYDQRKAEFEKKLSSLEPTTQDEVTKKLKGGNNSGSGKESSFFKNSILVNKRFKNGFDKPRSQEGNILMKASFSNRAQGWMNQFFNKPKNLDLKIPHHIEMDMNQKPMTPPNEEEKMPTMAMVNPGTSWGLEKPKTDLHITDDMILRYQKMDTLLNYGIEKVNENFTNYLWLKNMMEFYFVRYSPGASNKMHNVSAVNMKYALSIVDIFNSEDMAILKEVGKHDDLYNEDFDYFSNKITMADKTAMGKYKLELNPEPM
jgi:hypothetical protein